MGTPYRGLINPSYNNYGGQSLIITEKYNHRIYLNLVKPSPILTNKFRQKNQLKLSQEPIQNKIGRKSTNKIPTSTFQDKDNTKPFFFRNYSQFIDKQQYIQLLKEDPQNYPTTKKYQEKDSSQYLQYLNPKTDPYGHKETKYRGQLWRTGKSYASDLDKYTFKEECIIDLFKQLEKQALKNKESLTLIDIQEIIFIVVQEFHVRKIDSLAKLFNQIQKPYNLSIEQIQNLYYEIQMNMEQEQQ